MNGKSKRTYFVIGLVLVLSTVQQLLPQSDSTLSLSRQDFLGLIIFIIFLFVSWAFLIVVSIPPRPRKRISLRGKTPLVMPKLCAVTGRPANDLHTLIIFKGHPFYYGFSERYSVDLPFSESGWEQYSKRFPFSRKVYDSIFGLGFYFLAVINRVPLLGIMLAGLVATFLDPFMLGPLSVLCGLIAIIDLIMHKRQHVKVHKVRVREEEIAKKDIKGEKIAETTWSITGIDISVIDSPFIEEFIKLNPNTKLKRWWQFWR
jgi:hypothetical protein